VIGNNPQTGTICEVAARVESGEVAKAISSFRARNRK
jgi:hypothetical protein